MEVIEYTRAFSAAFFHSSLVSDATSKEQRIAGASFNVFHLAAKPSTLICKYALIVGHSERAAERACGVMQRRRVVVAVSRPSRYLINRVFTAAVGQTVDHQ